MPVTSYRNQYGIGPTNMPQTSAFSSSPFPGGTYRPPFAPPQTTNPFGQPQYNPAPLPGQPSNDQLLQVTPGNQQTLNNLGLSPSPSVSAQYDPMQQMNPNLAYPINAGRQEALRDQPWRGSNSATMSEMFQPIQPRKKDQLLTAEY